MKPEVIKSLNLQKTNQRIGGFQDCETYLWPEMCRSDRRVFIIDCDENENYKAIVDYEGKNHEVNIARTQITDKASLTKLRETFDSF